MARSCKPTIASTAAVQCMSMPPKEV
jgi:hypothetical protein